MPRILEPSTWAGLAAIAIGIKPFAPIQYGFIFDAVAAGFGGIAVVLRERGG